MNLIKLINNKRGSTLLMVLVMSVVLTILGTALIGMTFMNLNMKYTDMRGKVSRYYSEAGIDEAYAIVAHYVDEALVYATSLTTIQLEEYKKDDMNEALVYQEDGTLNDEHLQMIGDTYFRIAYKNFFENHPDFVPGDTMTDNMLAEIAAINTSIDTRESNADNNYVITVAEANLVPFSVGGDHMTIGDITSTFSYLDITDQTVSTDIVIREPDMQYPLQIVEEKVHVLNNPLWQNALVSNGDVIFSASNTLDITGDVYAKGYIPTTEVDRRNPTAYGGIKISEGTTTIHDGDLVTSSYLQVVNDDAALEISGANIFANSVVIQSGGNNGSIVATDSEVYTKDDIELNAPNGSIVIGGSYFGFSSGNTVGVTHDNSSSIIVNNTIQERNNATITITGQPGNNVYSSTHQGVYIAGTAYVNRTGATPYQTGESMAIETNYIFYRSVIHNDDVAEDFAYRSSNVTWDSSDGTYNYFDGIDGGSGANFNEKGEYFKAYYDTYQPTANAMQFYNNGELDGVNITINPGGLAYSLGLYFAPSTIPPFDNEIKDSYGEFNLVVPVLEESAARYNYYTMFLGNVNEFEYIGSGSEGIRDGVAARIASYGGSVPDVMDLYSDTSFNISNYTDDEKVFYETAEFYDYGRDGIEEAKELVAVHLNDPNVDRIVIKDASDAGGEPNTVYYEPNANGILQGIIIADCDVDIRADDLDFIGCIITDGDILINGNGDLSFTGYHFKDNDTSFNDEEQYILRLIYKYPILKDYFMFEPLLEAGTSNGIYNDTYGTIEYVYQDYIGLSETSDSNRDRYNQLIYFDNWTID